MAVREIVKQLAGTEDLLLGEGIVTQQRDSGEQELTRVGAASLPFDTRSPDIRSIKDELLVKVRHYDSTLSMVSDVANATIGELCFTSGLTAGDQQGTWWNVVDATSVTTNGVNILAGSATKSFVKLNSVGLIATTAELADITDPINTVNKAAGLQVFNTSTNKPVWSSGATAGAVWVNSGGTTEHTPV